MFYSCGGKLDIAKGRDRCQITRARVRGKKFFQVKCISWSYRNRGYEARTHKNIAVSREALIIRLNEEISGVK